MTLLQTFFPELYSTEYATNNNVTYNLIKNSDTEMLLEINVTGIPEENIDVEILGNKLTVTAKNKDDVDRKYLHRGITSRTFTRHFTLKDDILVKSASVKNGLLSIVLEVNVPEEKKPKKILLTH